MKDSPFGSYAVLENIRFHFENEPAYWWEIKPPSAGDEVKLNRYMNQGKNIMHKDGSLEIEGGPTWLEILFFEIGLLFGGTNIPEDPEFPVSEGGKPFIKAGASQATIEERLQKMPVEMINEIANQIAEHVEGWGPKKPLGRVKEEEESTPSES